MTLVGLYWAGTLHLSIKFTSYWPETIKRVQLDPVMSWTQVCIWEPQWVIVYGLKNYHSDDPQYDYCKNFSLSR